MASAAMRRLAKDLENMGRQRNPQVTVRPSSKSFLEWHFVLHHLPEDTVYKDGYYHGKLVFPEQYPMAPPALYMITPSGRLEVQQRLCLSMTDFHPESWNPAWTVESILVGLISFMVDDRDPQGLGVVHATADTRRRLASSSLEFNCRSQEFRELFPELASPEALPSVGTEDVVLQLQPAEEAGPQRPRGAEAQLELGLASSASPGPAAGAATPTQEVQALVAHAAIPVEADQIAPSASNDQGAPCALECWICYKDGSQEPLIQPCACRGSMSGVHASCVEDWIKHHRANALSSELPKCSVCHQAYCGTEKRPGPLQFAMEFVGGCLRFTLRVFFWWVLMRLYLEGARKHNHQPIWLRALLVAAVGGAFLYQSLVLAFSLPLGRLPPKYCGRFLFTLDSGLLVWNGCAMVMFLTINGILCGAGLLELFWFLPFCILPLLPLCSLACGMRRRDFAQTLLLIVFSPFIYPFLLLRLILKTPRRLVDPTDALMHLLVAWAVQPVCWFVRSSTPAVVILATHGAVVLAGLVEKVAVGRLRWKESDGWWGVILVTSQSTLAQVYFYVLKHGTLEGKALVLSTSLLWFSLVITLAILVNRARGVRQYRAWQNRNGSFRLHRDPPAPVAGPPPSWGAPPEVLGQPTAAEPV